jgi:Arc/MetJ-type ribon-helix-helix transcriptional regulator
MAEYDDLIYSHTMLRITVTLPEDVAAAADERAQRLDRSRSWVVAEALRRYLGPAPSPRPHADRDPEPTAEGRDLPPQPETSTPGLGPSRLEQLRADLRLTPEQRVKEAERTAREGARYAQPARQVLIMFDSFEDYLEWDRLDALG